MKRPLIITILQAVLLASCASQPGKSNAEKYYSEIQSRITNNWYRPSSAQLGLSCRLRITQQPGGEVISVAVVGKCNGDEATRRSMIEAVERSEPLTYKGFEDVFEREIDFVFTYYDD